jgi:hypothetical protein
VTTTAVLSIVNKIEVEKTKKSEITIQAFSFFDIASRRVGAFQINGYPISIQYLNGCFN